MFKWLRRKLLGPEQPQSDRSEALGTANALGVMQGRLDTLEKALAASEDAQRGFVKSQGDLQLEWATMLAKLNKWAARESARLRRSSERELDSLNGDTPADSPPPSAPSGDPRLLTKDQLRAAYSRGALRPFNGAKQ